MKLIITQVQLNVSFSTDFKIPEYHHNWYVAEYMSIFILEYRDTQVTLTHHTQVNHERFMLASCFLL